MHPNLIELEIREHWRMLHQEAAQLQLAGMVRRQRQDVVHHMLSGVADLLIAVGLRLKRWAHPNPGAVVSCLGAESADPAHCTGGAAHRMG